MRNKWITIATLMLMIVTASALAAQSSRKGKGKKAGKAAASSKSASAASSATSAPAGEENPGAGYVSDRKTEGKTPMPVPPPYKPSSMENDNLDWYGPWWRGAGKAGNVEEAAQKMKKEFPFVKGVFVALVWSKLEPKPGQFDWKYFDDTMSGYAKAGFYIQFMVWVGENSPRWIYDNGVPEVKTTPTMNPRGQMRQNETYPFYLDPDYQKFYWRMTREVAAHIDTLPKDVRSRIFCIQTAEGNTGDEGGYKGEPLDPKYIMPDAEWRAFKYKTWDLYNELYSKKQPPIHILTNSGNSGQYVEWLAKNAPDWWRKAGNPGHGFQLNNEMDMFAFLDPIMNHPNENGHFVRVRSEMDESFKGWFQENELWNQYWLNVWGLTFGLDIFQHETNVISKKNEEGFLFYAKYGGQKDPATAPGAFCAMHDGLDAADYTRFPKAEFGDAALDPRAADKTPQINRVNAIVKKFAAYGAKQGDMDKSLQVVMQNRSAEKMNDVGWNIWDDNYHRYLKQIDPNGTSVGWWRVGPADQPYGRFARGFEEKSGKKAMFFDLDDNFYYGQPEGARTVELRVVYLDKGKGSWALKYDAAGGQQKTAFEVTNTDSGRWVEKKVTVSDAQFKNGGPNNSDLTLEKTGGDDTIFHMVELTRGK